MADINNPDVELSASQLKFYMAVKELEKRNQLNELFDHLNLKSVAKQEPNETSKAVIDAYMKFSGDAMKVIVKNHPEVIDEIQKKIDAQDLTDELESAGVSATELDQNTIEFLKTTKHFESEFPDPEKPSLKERMVAAKDLVAGALGSDKGKIAVNAVMLGVAVGTGGAGVIAGAKLVAAVANMAMKNPSVAKTFEKVQGRVTDYLVEAGVDVSSIAKGHQMVVHTLKDQVEKRPWLKRLAVPALLVGAAVGAVLIHQDFDAVKNLAAQAQDYAEKALNGDVSSLGFSPEVGDPKDLTSGMNIADSSVLTDGSISAPDVASVPSDAGIQIPDSGVVAPDTGIATPDGAVGIDSPEFVADLPQTASPVTDGMPPASGVEVAQAVSGAGGVHVVTQGESIWKITKGLLPEGASNHDIAAGVQSFIDANPSVASHPNLIFPGDSLVIPDHLQPSVQPTMVSDVANSLVDVKIDVPQIVPVMPDIDLSSLELTSMEPNSSAVLIPDAAVTLANEAAASKDLAKEAVKNAVTKGSSFTI